MNTGKNRVKGLKTELFKKKFQVGGQDNYQGRPIADAVPSSQQAVEDRMRTDALRYSQQPLRFTPPAPQYSQRQINRMKNNFDLGAEDFYIDPLTGYTPMDLTQGQGNGDMRNQSQVLGDTERMTSNPANLSMFQNDQFNQVGAAEAEKSLNTTFLGNLYDQTKDFVKDFTKDIDYRQAIRSTAGAIAGGKGRMEDLQNRDSTYARIQNTNDRPRYMPNEYQFMGRPGSQSTIYAKAGAEIRRGTDTGAEEAELERGEMFMLPTMDSYVVGGKKHSQGGETFVLPQGTIVFSDYLKVPGTSKTFANEAKKYDITKYKETLGNTFAKTVDRDTAEVMMNRNVKKLQQLFQTQQEMNGNSNGELKQSMRQGQKGMMSDTPSPQDIQEYLRNQQQATAPITMPPVNLNTATTPQIQSVVTTNPLSPITPPVASIPSYTPEQSQEVIANQTGFNNTPNVNSKEKKKAELEQLVGVQIENEDQYQAAKINAAAKVQANPGSLTGSQANPAFKTTAEAAGLLEADALSGGTVGKTNATDPNSMYRAKTADGRSYYVENQGEFKGKKLKDQYGGSVWNLTRNRLEEFGDQLGNLLMDSYTGQTKGDNSIRVANASQLIDIMESGNEGLDSMRRYYESIGQTSMLFDPALDKGADGNAKQKKTADLMKGYIESRTFATAVAEGKASVYMPWLKGEIKEVKDANGQISYTIDTAELDQTFVKKYQAAYRAFGSVKSNQKSRGKDDMLRGFRIAPEGLDDQQYMGLPISPVDSWGGNTTIGQISAFEDDPIPSITKKPPGDSSITTDPGKDYTTKLTEAPTGKYTKLGFDYTSLAPEVAGLSGAQVYPYATIDSNAQYLMPQTLNIQPQLQDVDSSFVAALNAGADPNSAFISTLNAKQKLYSEKQNFDAQQRASTDQINANARWQEDQLDITSLDKVYNGLIAQSDDARTAQIQSLVASATKKSLMHKQEENRKSLYYDNFMRNYNFDGKTGQFSLSNGVNYDPFNIDATGQPTLLTLAEQKEAIKQAMDKKTADQKAK